MKNVITFIGMSGVGKSYMSQQLAKWGWYRYSCDENIGADLIGNKDMTEDEILDALAKLVGRLGNRDKGGLPLKEFRKRQSSYYHAECRSLLFLDRHIDRAASQGFENFIHDSTGSFCEIEDEVVLESVGEISEVCYIESSPEHAQEVVERAQKHPKPLFFPPSKFMSWYDGFMAEHGLSSDQEIDPDTFSRWVFPKLFEQRLPKYKKLADQYGYTVPSSALTDVQNTDEFLEVVNQYR
ncbi:MAG: hypothetical protein JKY71_08030 [Alphaproteobacteria bacterium]|nr:hypothetical protein [Alphaproteobacteria bacterium]